MLGFGESNYFFYGLTCFLFTSLYDDVCDYMQYDDVKSVYDYLMCSIQYTSCCDKVPLFHVY